MFFFKSKLKNKRWKGIYQIAWFIQFLVICNVCLQDFMEVIAPLISIERQMKNLVSCMTSLLSASTLPVRVCKRGWGGHLYILDMYKHVYNIYNYMIYTIYSLYFFVRAVTQANKKKEFMHLILYFAMLTKCAYRRCLKKQTCSLDFKSQIDK